jgi:transcriptional regulator with XRE-family HTH domain
MEPETPIAATAALAQDSNRPGLGAYIRDRRRALGLSQRDLARAIHRSQALVGRWEKSAPPDWLPPAAILLDLARALQMHPRALLEIAYPGPMDEEWFDSPSIALAEMTRIVRRAGFGPITRRLLLSTLQSAAAVQRLEPDTNDLTGIFQRTVQRGPSGDR